VTLRGHVQGVGYRSFAQREALRLGLTGFVRNLPARDEVEVLAAGEEAPLEDFLARLRRGPSGSSVRQMTVERLQTEATYREFAIRY